MTNEKARAEIGARVRERREALGMSQDELAFALRYSGKAAISKIERGVNDIPRKKVLEFAIELKTSPEYLEGWTEDPLDYEAIASDIPDEIIDVFNGDIKTAYRAWQARISSLDEKYGSLFDLLDKVTPEQLVAVENLLKTIIPSDDSNS